jgi:hypothetical protein
MMGTSTALYITASEACVVKEHSHSPTFEQSGQVLARLAVDDNIDWVSGAYYEG